MFTNVNLDAPVGALAFLGTGLLLFVAALVFAYSLITRRFAWARVVFVLATALALAYLGVLVVFSLASSKRLVARGQEKYFCEIDCHLAYSILDVRQTKMLGAPTRPMTAGGTFYVITVRTRFDETTISSTRGDSPLTPNSRLIRILDHEGRTFTPSLEAELALANAEGTGTALTTPLRPGQSYTTSMVFDLPADVRNPALLVREGHWLTHFVIGHENSFFHKKTMLELGV